jgi:hypothetical protein
MSTNYKEPYYAVFSSLLLLSLFCVYPHIYIYIYVCVCVYIYILIEISFEFFYSGERPPLWPSGQSFWLQIQRSRVRFP